MVISPEENREVAVEWSKRTDLASRQQLNDLLAFYQRANFNLENNRLIWRLAKGAPNPANR